MDAGDLKKIAKSPKSIGLSVVTLIMLVVFLISLGQQMPQVWPLAVELEEPTSLSVFDHDIIVVDRQQSRFTSINRSGTVDAVSTIGFEDLSKEQYGLVLVTESGTYYTVATIFSDSVYVKSEKVYFKGNASLSSRLIFERTYSEDQKILSPLFWSLLEGSDGADVLLLAQTADRESVEVISLVENAGQVVARREMPLSNERIKSFAYNESSDMLAITTQAGDLYLVDSEGMPWQIEPEGFAYFSDCAWDDQGRLFCINAYDHSLSCVDVQQKTVIAKVADNSYYCLETGLSEGLILCGTENGIDVFDASSFSADNPGETITPILSTGGSIPFSLWMAVKSLLVWISVVYLIACILVILIRLVRRLVKDGQKAVIGRAAVVASVVVLVIAVSAFYSARFYSFAEKGRLDSLEAMCQDIATEITDAADDILELAADDDPEVTRQRAIAMLGSTLERKSAAYADTNISIRTVAVFAGDNMALALVASAEGYTLQSSAPDENSFNRDDILQLVQQAADTPLVQVEEIAQSTAYTALRGVTSSDGSVVGAIKLFSDASNLIVSYRNLCFDMLMTMLAVGGGVVLVIIEGRQLLRDRVRLREEREKDDGRPEIWTTRQLNFWGCLVAGFDSSLSVLIAQEILTARGAVQVDALVGLPAALGALGVFLGCVAYYFLVSRVSARKMSIVGAIGAFVMFVCAALAVWKNAFLLFCLFRFGASFFLTLPTSIVFAIPHRAKEGSIIGELFDGCKISSISGGALGCLICGYVAQYLGNASVYLACLIPVVIIIVVLMRFMPKKVVFETSFDGGETTGTPMKCGVMLRFFLSPSIVILLLCIVLPSMLFYGYKTVLFPLFMADEGLSKVYITTIVACSNVLIFAALPALIKVKDGFNKWWFVICVMLFAAVVLAWFVVNSSPAWAICSLFLLGICYRLCSRRSFLGKQAKLMEISSSRANDAYTILQQLLSSLKSPVLSALAGLGQSVVCLVLSGICLAGAGVFALATRNHPVWRGKKPKEVAPADEVAVEGAANGAAATGVTAGGNATP